MKKLFRFGEKRPDFTICGMCDNLKSNDSRTSTWSCNLGYDFHNGKWCKGKELVEVVISG